MAKPLLVTEERVEGEVLLRELDQRGVPIEAAFWLYLEDAEGYRLVLASPLYDKLGVTDLYGVVLDIVRELAERVNLTSSDITVRSPSDPLVQKLHAAYATGAEIAGIRLRGTSVGGAYIKDAYVYRA